MMEESGGEVFWRMSCNFVGAGMPGVVVSWTWLSVIVGGLLGVWHCVAVKVGGCGTPLLVMAGAWVLG